MLNSWGIKRCRGSCRGRCRETGRRQLRYRASIEQQRIRLKNRSSIDPPGVKELSKRQELSRSIHQVSRRCRDYVKKKAWKAQQIARYQGGVEPVFQNSLSREEKHRHECNLTYNSTNDPINILSSQNHPSTTIFKHMDLKNTHTQNKSNQFYISKTKSRQFSEHTLTHVNLVMTKSHCTRTCIKSSKEFWVLCVKNIARLQMCQHVITIWDMWKSL